jgi:thioredoxin reductase (NADPH)
VSPPGNPLTHAIREFSERMGMPTRVYPPESEQGREVVDRFVASRPAPPQFGDVFGVGDDA